jgi:hypothetical protein
MNKERLNPLNDCLSMKDMGEVIDILNNNQPL